MWQTGSRPSADRTARSTRSGRGAPSAEDGRIEAWIAALQARDGSIREHARERLVEVGEQATGELMALLESGDRQARWEAVKALTEIADPRTVPALLRALQDDDNDVCWVAAEGLAAIGPEAVVPLLQLLIRDGESFKVRQGAHRVLRQLRHSRVGTRIRGVYEALSGVNADVGLIAEARRAVELLTAGRS